MLRITTETNDAVTTLRLEGRLAGPWVDVLDRYWHIATDSDVTGLVVELSDVTFIDRAGKELLVRMHEKGATFQAHGCLTKCIVEEITTHADRTWSAESKPAGKIKGE
jgi:anti-anti-sigma regulatory factor